MDFSSVRKAAEEIRQRFPDGVDVLCNNAGIMADEDKATKDGTPLDSFFLFPLKR
jgi:short-subunit dehydrogenase involved in D-alanine esterification of teichoic acids